MLTVHLLRHGNSDFGGPDLDRTLSGDGADELRLVLSQFRPERVAELTILASHAQRCQQSAEIVRSHLDCLPWTSTPELYLATHSEILQVLAKTPRTTRELMIVGHNPGLSQLATSWAAGRPIGLPTAGLASFRLDISDPDFLEIATATPIAFLSP
ncbi:MAG: histidine phosphatase family protein [Planctomycetota bacterium]